MDLTTNGVAITDAIKFVQTNKEKLMSTKGENKKESKEPDYDDEDEELEEKQEEEKGEKATTNTTF